MIEALDNSIQEPLKPHSYPIPLYILAILLLFGIIYFGVAFLPQYRELISVLKEADLQFKKKNYVDAIQMYEGVWEYIKTDQKRVIKVAETYFALGNDKKALKKLRGITLNKENWKLLKTFMPREYRILFTSVRRR